MSAATPLSKPSKLPRALIACSLAAGDFLTLEQAGRGGLQRHSRARMRLCAAGRDGFGRGIGMRGHGQAQTISVPGHDFATLLSLRIDSQEPGLSYQPMGLISCEQGSVHRPGHMHEFPRFEIGEGMLTLDLSDPDRRDFGFLILIERSSDGQMGALLTPMAIEVPSARCTALQAVRAAPLSVHQWAGSLGLSNSSRPRWWFR